jgi:EmrB/QacA subfamily drug resistance transporter
MPENHPPGSGTSPSERMPALLIATVSSFLTPFMLSSINVALPAIGREFQADAVLLSWVATAYLLAAAIALVPFGKLADIHGRKRIHVAGTALFSLACGLAGLAGSVPTLIVLRVFQGIGVSMVFATGLAILTSVFPAEERGRVLGITVAAVYTGLSLGPFAGGWLTQLFTWRSIFLLNAALGAAVIVLIRLKLKGEWFGARGEGFDLSGTLIYAAAVAAFMLGVTQLPGAAGFALIAAGAAGGVLFVRWELKAPAPVFEVRLFSASRVFTFSSLAALIHYSATFGVTFLMSLFLQYIKGYPPRDAGLVLIAQPVMMALFSPFAGRLSDRVEPRVISSGGMGLTALGLFLLAFIDAGTGLVFIVACLMTLGLGFGLFSSPNMNAIMGAVEKRYYGVASGAVGTMRLLGQMLSMGIATLIFALLLGRAPITPETHAAFVRSVRAAHLCFLILCVAGVFFSLARGRLRSGPH